MPNPTGEIFLNPKPIKVGAEWQVIAQYQNGEFERICGFQSEVEGLQWIKDASGAWLSFRRNING